MKEDCWRFLLFWSCKFDVRTFGGIEIKDGAIGGQTAAPWINPRESDSLKIVDIDAIGGSAGSLTYDIVLGDFTRYMNK